MSLKLYLGWIPVSRDEVLDLESFPLEIKTDSALGSYDMVDVFFYSAEGKYAGGVYLRFTSTLQYLLAWCTSWTNLPVNPPSATDKVWRISLLTRTAGVRLVIHCNDVEVLNKLLSSTCSDSMWSTIWNRDVTKIEFHSQDTASDYYRAGD